MTVFVVASTTSTASRVACAAETENIFTSSATEDFTRRFLRMTLAALIVHVESVAENVIVGRAAPQPRPMTLTPAMSDAMPAAAAADRRARARVRRVDEPDVAGMLLEVLDREDAAGAVPAEEGGASHRPGL